MRIPVRKKRSRYERAKRALRELLPETPRPNRPAPRPVRHPHPLNEIEDNDQDYSGLHWMAAGLFLAAGAEAAFGERRGDYRPPEALRWAPLVAAPLAIAAQAARAIAPTRTTRVASQVANAVAVAVGAAGLVGSVNAVRHLHQYDLDYEPSLLETIPSLAPLAFGAVGVLGLLLDSEDDATTPARTKRRRVQRIRIRV